MRWLVLAALLVACGETPAAPTDATGRSFEFRVQFDRADGSVVVNGQPFTQRLVFVTDSYAEAMNALVLDVSVTTATGTLMTQLRPGFCATSPAVDLAELGLPVTLESVGYMVIEAAPPYISLSSFVCEGTRGGAAGSP